MMLNLNTSNFGIQEASIPSERTREMFPGTPTLKDGMMWSNGKPGLGIEIDEEETAFRIDRDVAKRIEHAVSGVIREQQQSLVRSQYETRLAAAMRYVDSVGPVTLLGELAGDKECVRSRD